jgi:wyosine [tRNA(Phe)-imidazoG37] synthetase (radical SAM superfamily)
MITRNVTIEREGKYWLVRIDGTDGLTQARYFDEVELMAREYISLAEDVTIDQVEIGAITVQGASSRIAEAARERQQARELEAAATRKIREVATELHSRSVPLKEIGAILGVSHQRAHQLIAA